MPVHGGERRQQTLLRSPKRASGDALSRIRHTLTEHGMVRMNRPRYPEALVAYMQRRIFRLLFRCGWCRDTGKDRDPYDWRVVPCAFCVGSTE